MPKDWIDLVKEFNAAYDIKTPCRTDRDIDLQFELIAEEYDELCVAYSNIETLDAIADLIYVLIGLALKCGYDLDGAVREVHRSNMSKLGADGLPIYRADGKIMKGPNFTPPNLDAYI